LILFGHRVGDVGDHLVGQLGTQRADQVMLDVAHGHPTRVQRDDHVVQAAGAAGALGHQPGLEHAGPIPRHGQPHVTDLGGQGLGRGAVARVRDAPPGRVALLIAQVPGQLGLQGTLEHRPDQLGQKPALPGQRQPTGIDLIHHRVQQPGLDHVVDRIPRRRHRLRLRHPQRMPQVFLQGHLCTPSAFSELILPAR
jgi:hypothetical protein